ncbi:hypothetical protein AKO1_013525, partial [Acrasis kona]
MKHQKGVDGWYTLTDCTHGNTAGAIKVMIQLDAQTTNIMFPSTCSYLPHHHSLHVDNYNNFNHVVYDVCRFTIIVEEVFVPNSTMRSILLPSSNPQQCHFFIRYQFYNEKNHIKTFPKSTTSTIFYHQNQNNKPYSIKMNHTMEYKRVMNDQFINLCMCEKQCFDLYVMIDEEEIYLGTCYYDMAALLSKREASTKNQPVVHSGMFSLINPTSMNLSNGHMKIKIMCDTLKYTFTDDGYHGDEENKEREEEESQVTDEYDNGHQVVMIDNQTPPQTPKRTRVEVIKTISPFHSIAPSTASSPRSISSVNHHLEPEEQPSRNQQLQQPVVITTTANNQQQEQDKEEKEEEERVEIINQLSVCVDSAYHLPLVSRIWSAHPIQPSCYVKIITFQNEFYASDHVHSNSGSFSVLDLISAIDKGHIRSKTHVVKENTCPSWAHHVVLPLSRQIDSVVFQVWSKLSSSSMDASSSSRDQLIGECVVDLNPLVWGMDRIEGWYGLQSRRVNDGVLMNHSYLNPSSHQIAHLKVCISPEKPYMFVRGSLGETPRTSQDYNSHLDDKQSLLVEQDEHGVVEHHDVGRDVVDGGNENVKYVDELLEMDADQLRDLLRSTLQDLDSAMSKVT